MSSSLKDTQKTGSFKNQLLAKDKVMSPASDIVVIYILLKSIYTKTTAIFFDWFNNKKYSRGDHVNPLLHKYI